MHAYGDESGHLRSLLEGNCAVFVLAVVVGEQHDCGACPKQAVRRITDLDEAKWRDLTENQKRRVVDCLADQERELSYGYIALNQSDLQNLDNSYLLYQDRAFDIEWDLSVIGHGYAYLLKHVIGDEERIEFTFDRLVGQTQSDRIRQVIFQSELDTNVQHESSHSTQGIQAADCVAGLVAETHRDGQNWVNEIHERTTALSSGFVDVLNTELFDQE